jgi:hypothetical protein
MGKIFLLAIVGVAIWSGYSLLRTWNQQFRFSDGKEEKVEPPSRTKDRPAEGPLRPARLVAEDEPDDFPRVVSWRYRSEDGVALPGEGVVRVGDEIAGGWVIVSWDHRGLVVVKGGKTVRSRWQRTGETLAHSGVTSSKGVSGSQAGDVDVLDFEGFGVYGEYDP